MLSIAVNITLVLYGLFFTGAAAMKLTRHSHMVEEFKDMQLPYWLATLSGLVEIICGPAMVVGVWYPWIAGLATALLFATMLGAALINLIGRSAQFALGVSVVFLTPMALLFAYHLDDTLILLAQLR